MNVSLKLVLYLLLLPLSLQGIHAAEDKSIPDPVVITGIEHGPLQTVCKMVIEEIYRRLEIPLRVLMVPGERALIMSSEGQVQGESCRIKAIEDMHPSLLRIPTPMWTLTGSAFGLKENVNKVDGEGWESIKDFKVARVMGVVFTEIGTKGFPYVFVVRGNNQLITLVKNKRVDFMVTSQFSGMIALKRTAVEGEIIPLKGNLVRLELFHYIHEDYKETLFPILARKFSELESSGEMEKIFSHYANVYQETIPSK